MSTNCTNCNAELTSKFCGECGQPRELHRIDGHYIIHEIEHVLHFERGILYTIKELLTNPGKNVRNYLSKNRSRLVKPIIFIIVTSLIYTLCNHFFHFEEGYVKYYGEKRTSTGGIFKWVEGHYGYSNIIMGMFIAFWIRLFFKKFQFNFFEILVLLCFVMGIGMLVFSVFGIIQALTHFTLMQIAGGVGIVYTSWAIGQFYGSGKALNYLKAFAAYILGMVTFTFAAMLIGATIDLLIR